MVAVNFPFDEKSPEPAQKGSDERDVEILQTFKKRDQMWNITTLSCSKTHEMKGQPNTTGSWYFFLTSPAAMSGTGISCKT